MNYIDAHRIVYDYVNVISQQNDDELYARRMSTLHNSKREIINAYKLFVAHMFVFDTCTQEEYEIITSLVYSIGLFVEDDLIQQLLNCQTIVSNDSVLQHNSRKEIEDANTKYEFFSKRLIDEIGPLGENEEIDTFVSSIKPIAKTYKKRIYDASKGPNSFSAQLMIINEYCHHVYTVAGIKMSDDDVEFFYPVKVLRFFADKPNLADLFGKYKEYIFSRM